MQASTITFDHFSQMQDDACQQRILAAKARLGKKLVILGHHYQRDDVICHADFTGDSLKLSRQAAASEAEYIVFCGVHFMAEVADILSRPEQIAILPDLSAGCSMADMASLAKVERAWRELKSVLNPDESVTPVTYINSAADLKAFCGEHGGIVCTSSNATRILEWSFAQREKVLFFPDQNLGRWSGHKMGIPMDEMVLWDYDQPLGGLTPEQIRKARIILWKGLCSVHQMFQPQHIRNFRAQHPDGHGRLPHPCRLPEGAPARSVPAGIGGKAAQSGEKGDAVSLREFHSIGKVISHPECSFEVCELSDYVGSTEYIIKTIAEADAGTHWLVGTELNLVNRLAKRFKDQGKVVQFMSSTVCMCSTMARIDPQHLAWTLENLAAGQVVNQISVPTQEAELARLSLQRMLDASI